MEKIFIGEVKIEACWKIDKGTYIDYASLYIGKVKIASFFYDSTRPVKSEKKYKVVSYLPSLKAVIGHYETQEKAKEICVEAAKYFYKQLRDI